VETQRTKRIVRDEPADPASIERGVRQLLSDKVSGTLAGIWLLVPEHLRLGTWDLLRGWTCRQGAALEPRLAMQLVHEAALCRKRLRLGDSLGQKGFELANGLPFVATDKAVHELLGARTTAETEQLQVAFTAGVSSRTVSQGTPVLLDRVGDILRPGNRGEVLVLADKEHLTADLFEHVVHNTRLDLLVPFRHTKGLEKKLKALPEEAFTRRWAGLATAKLPFYFSGRKDIAPLYRLVQRCGEGGDYQYQAFLATSDCDEVRALCDQYPRRWRVEEFFNANQDLGWKNAGTLNLHIRYGKMTMALIAQAAIHQLRTRLQAPHDKWDAAHLAKNLFGGLQGDIRVEEDVIIVTYYNAPYAEHLRSHYQGLPAKLADENVDPRIPWLYGFKLDFRFR
jgi:hypothetical protein